MSIQDHWFELFFSRVDVAKSRFVIFALHYRRKRVESFERKWIVFIFYANQGELRVQAFGCRSENREKAESNFKIFYLMKFWSVIYLCNGDL